MVRKTLTLTVQTYKVWKAKRRGDKSRTPIHIGHRTRCSVPCSFVSFVDASKVWVGVILLHCGIFNSKKHLESRDTKVDFAPLNFLASRIPYIPLLYITIHYYAIFFWYLWCWLREIVSKASYILEMREVWLVPFVNPDGYVANQATKSCDDDDDDEDEIVRQSYDIVCFVCFCAVPTPKFTILYFGMAGPLKQGSTGPHTLYLDMKTRRNWIVAHNSDPERFQFFFLCHWLMLDAQIQVKRGPLKNWNLRVHTLTYVCLAFLQVYHARPPSQEHVFTSLRDGNRPHRIVGLTQQGHDSGAERKVERRSWGLLQWPERG